MADIKTVRSDSPTEEKIETQISLDDLKIVLRHHQVIIIAFKSLRQYKSSEEALM